MSATPAAVRSAVTDLTLASGSRAWLVAREADDDPGRPRPAVLWLHWLGHRHNDRGEFLPLAVELASRGVVSLLPAGHFPWVPDPDGTATDVQRIRDQIGAHAAALDHLAAQLGVDPARIAVVGHDYGGMYAALLAAGDQRIGALALQAVDASWENWFASYWLKLEGDARADYAALFTDLDPVAAAGRAAARLGDRLLLQWAGNDTFVDAAARAAYERACPQAHSLDYPTADHMLGDSAARDLIAFLEERLGLDRD